MPAEVLVFFSFLGALVVPAGFSVGAMPSWHGLHCGWRPSLDDLIFQKSDAGFTTWHFPHFFSLTVTTIGSTDLFWVFSVCVIFSPFGNY
jgi:hypothetical protein